MNQYQFDEQCFLKDLRALLKIKSVSGDCGAVTPAAPLGQGVYDALAHMVALGESFGFGAKNLDGLCAWIEMGEGERMVGILAHVDTVSVEDSGWIADPFDGTVIDGLMYGRGVGDNKGPAMAALYAMKAVADSGVKLDKRVRLILGGDEEAGWKCMTRYKQTEETPSCAFTPDSEYPVTYAEKGILHARIFRALDSSVPPLTLESGKLFNVVPAYAHATLDGTTYEATGRAAHALEPQKGENAMLALCETLRANGLSHPFTELAHIANAADLHIAFSDAPSGALTINPAVARVTPDHAELICDIRIPVTFGADEVINAIAKSIAPLGFAVENTHFSAPLHVDQNTPLVQTLQGIYREITGRDDKPVSTGGGTYARAFDNAVAFGALFPGEIGNFHQTNECWAVDSMRKNFQIIANAIAML